MLMVLGASHHDLELSELDRLAAGADTGPDGLAELGGGQEPAVHRPRGVATCNRVEIYLDAARFHDAIELVGGLVAQAGGLTVAQASTALKVRVGAPVAAHLFAVTAGLDSMVVGEAEISGQVSRALTRAQQAELASSPLHSLFQSALRTAKKVVATTDLGQAGRSVASVALDLALAGRPAPTGALIIGTGAYARVVAAALRSRGATALSVYSPSGRAEAFAATHHAAPVVADGLVEALAVADLVVACSGTGGEPLTVSVLGEALARRDRPLPVLDLALHSDLEPGAAELPGLVVTGLRTVAEGIDPHQRDAVTAAQDLVIDAVAKFEEEQAVRSLDPAVTALRQHVSGAVGREMDRFRDRYPDLPAGIAKDLELAMHRVSQSLLHTPTLRARELARTGSGADYLAALHTLFGISVPAHPVPASGRPASVSASADSDAATIAR